MRLFIYELLSAGGLGVAPASLRREGWAMLSAVVEDFAALPHVEVGTLLDRAAADPLGTHCRRIDAADEPHAFRDLAARADAALIIAPETDDLLAIRSEWAQGAGCALLGSAPAAIRTAGDKLRSFEVLRAQEVPTPPTELWGRFATGQDQVGCEPAPRVFPCVLKPRHGAGSQATFLIANEIDWSAALRSANLEQPDAELIVQPYCPGIAASIALLIGRRQIVATPGAYQRLSADGRFHYQGGQAPLPAPLRLRAEALAHRAAACVPGLHGYVGIDLVLGDEPAADVVVDINPRLTTSYLGLRQLAYGNLAAWWLRLVNDEAGVEVSWRDGPVAWSVI